MTAKQSGYGLDVLIAAPADIRWTDEFTAVGTVALAALGLITIIVSVLSARRQRLDEATRATAARNAAEKTLRDERELSESRLRDERNWAAAERRNEQSAQAASLLLSWASDVQRLAGTLVGANTAVWSAGTEPRDVTELRLASRRATQVDIAALLDESARERVRILAHLVSTALDFRGGDAQVRTRWVGDISNYALYVVLTLQGVIDGNPIDDPGDPPYPDLDRIADMGHWAPSRTPKNWQDAINSDPSHVQWRRIPRPNERRNA